MGERSASTLTIGLLAVISVLVTAYVIPVPIWVVFIAWAAFVASGGGRRGAIGTLVMGVAGVVSSTIVLSIATLLGGSPIVVGICCFFGAGSLVAVGAFRAFWFTPAGFFGFASTAGVSAATGTSLVSPPVFTHPSILVIVAFVVGIVFGLASQYGPLLFQRRATPAAGTTGDGAVTPESVGPAVTSPAAPAVE